MTSIQISFRLFCFIFHLLPQFLIYASFNFLGIPFNNKRQFIFFYNFLYILNQTLPLYFLNIFVNTHHHRILFICLRAPCCSTFLSQSYYCLIIFTSHSDMSTMENRVPSSLDGTSLGSSKPIHKPFGFQI